MGYRELKCCIIVISIILSVFLIIGLSTYLSGCHPTIQPNCLRYYDVNTKVLRHNTLKFTCSACVSYSTTCYTKNNKRYCDTKCSLYRYYDCFSSYVKLQFKIPDLLNPQDRLVDRTCDLEVSYQLESESTALQIAQNTYPVNSIQNTFIDKNTLLCANTSSVYALAINGLVFLILSGITFIVLLIFLFICIKNECINNQSYDLQNETPILNTGSNNNLDSVEIQGYNFNQNTSGFENEKPNYMRDNSKNSNDISSSSYSYSLNIVNNNAPTNNTYKNSNIDSDFKSAEYGYSSNINNMEVNNNPQLPSLNEIEQSSNQQNNYNYGYNANVDVIFFIK